MLKAFTCIRLIPRINSVGELINKNNYVRRTFSLRIVSNEHFSIMKYSLGHPFKIIDHHYSFKNLTKFPFSTGEIQLGSLSSNEFEIICSETLESLCEYFELLIEDCGHLKGCDITYSDGVLTVNFGDEFGTYVINRQTPNRQIWLSSPTSGPKRYDYVSMKKQWIYRHDNKSLHELLQEEIPKIVETDVNFFECAYAGR